MITFRNPVVRGTAPDPSVVRVGTDYFLATSTFEMLPGIVLRHSTDLIHWNVIGAAVRHSSQVRRDGRPGAFSLFAPTIRFGDGRFVIACTNVEPGQGNFLLTARDPSGEWSDALWLDEGGFDPSLLHDGQRWIYTRRSLEPLADGRLGPVVQAEIDIETGELGDLRPITPGHQGWCSNDIEGPHLYRVGDWYYLSAAEGGTWKGHMQTIARSRDAYGPFEPHPNNPVLTHRHRVGHPVQSVGHADLVDTPAGDWWALCLGTRHQASGPLTVHHNLGRETFLVPVDWQDGWPSFGDDGRIDLEMEVDRRPLKTHRSQRRTASPTEWQTISDVALPNDQPGVIAVPLGARWDASRTVGTIGMRLRAQQEDTERMVASFTANSSARIGGGFWADRHHWIIATAHVTPPGDIELQLERGIDDLHTVEKAVLPGAHRAGGAKQDVPLELVLDASPQRYTVTLGFQGETPPISVTCAARLLSAEATEWFTGVRLVLVAAYANAAPDSPTVDHVRIRVIEHVTAQWAEPGDLEQVALRGTANL